MENLDFDDWVRHETETAKPAGWAFNDDWFADSRFAARLEDTIRRWQNSEDQSETLEQELDACLWLRDQLNDVFHCIRAVTYFSGWLESPGRDLLFENVCRNITAAEWEHVTIKEEAIPWVFQQQGEEFANHVRLCPLCRLQYHLGSGRQQYGGSSASRWLARLTHTTCSEALSALLAPSSNVDFALDSNVFDGPAPQLTVSKTPRTGSRNRLRVNARIEGQPSLGLVELIVIAQFVPRKDQPQRALRVFPGEGQHDAIVDLSRGRQSLEFVVPRPAVESGRYFFRYGVRPYQAGQQLHFSDAEATYASALGPGEQTAAPIDAKTYEITGEGGAAFLDWDEGS